MTGQGVSGLTAQNIWNFQNLNFYLPGSITSGASVLTLTEDSATVLGIAGNPANINVWLDGNTSLTPGSKIYLINKTGSGTLTAAKVKNHFVRQSLIFLHVISERLF